jgi:predicted RNA-binding Zn ribbon-like protein
MTRSTKPAFRFGLGHPALEFAATLAGRLREPQERLAEPHDLSRWLSEAGLAVDGPCDDALLDEARTLREAIYRTLDAARANRRPRRADVDQVNRWARQPVPVPQLTAKLQSTWSAADPARAALARIAAASVELIAGADLGRIRNCADPTCSLLFIDHSRPGRRRWCSMDGCGNRDKTARYRHRHRSTPPGLKYAQRGHG